MAVRVNEVNQVTQVPDAQKHRPVTARSNSHWPAP